MAGEVTAAAGAAGEAAAHGSGGMDVLSVVILLAAAVIAVPLFRRLGLGSVLGYLLGLKTWTNMATVTLGTLTAADFVILA